MKVFRNIEEIEGIRNPVVTTGSFDGVHLGHLAIIKRINRLARETGGESVLITFFPHPRKVLYPETIGKDLQLINSQREKISLLEKTGLNNLVIIPFTKAFSQTSSQEFIEKILVKRIHANVVVVGFNHHFGHNREGDFDSLHKLGDTHGFKVELIPEQELHNETISSTKIRKALHKGDIQKANAYLGYRYRIKGDARTLLPETYPQHQNWYELALEEDCKLVPPNGLYVTGTYIKGLQYKGLSEIRDNTRKKEGCHHDKQVFVRFFDLNEDIHGCFTSVLFAKRLMDAAYQASVSARERAIRMATETVKELIY